MKSAALLFCLVSLVSSPLMAAPVVSPVDLYSSFGPEDSYDASSGSFVGTNPFSGLTQSSASLFTVTGGDYQLDRIDVAVRPNANDPLAVSLVADSGGLPGSVLESFTIPSEVLLQVIPGWAILSVDSLTKPLLEDGSSYWVVLGSAGPNTSVAWCNSSPEVIGTYAINTGAGWYVNSDIVPAYRVTATPEPATLGLLALGGLAVLRRRGRIR